MSMTLEWLKSVSLSDAPKKRTPKREMEIIKEQRKPLPRSESRKNKPGPARSFTDEEIIAIRNDPRSAREVSQAYNTHHIHITNIRRGRVYADVGGPIGSRAEKAHKPALTDDQVRRLREYEGKKTIDEWAEEYGISRNAVFRAKNGATYRGVPSTKELCHADD